MFFVEYTALRKIYRYYLINASYYVHKKAIQKQSLSLYRFI